LTPSAITLVNTQTGAATSTTINLLVQGKNTLTMSASNTQPGSGSKIAYYTFKAYNASGTLFYEKKVTSTASFQAITIGPVSYSGTLKFQVTATDARGRTSVAAEKTISSHAYTKPSITSFNISRSITNGVNYLNCTYTPKYSSVNSKNTITVTMHYNNSYAYGNNNEMSINIGNDSATTYKAYLTIRDSLGGYAVTATQTIYGASRVMNVSADGTGIAFGKMSEKNQWIESRWTFSAPRGRFTATTDASGTSQENVALRIGDENGKHVDIDGNEIIAKGSGTTLNFLSLSGSAVNLYSGTTLTLKVGADATSEYVESDVTYNRTYSSAPNMYITSNGVLGRATSSSERYKKDITKVVNNELNPYKILDIPVVQYRYKEEYVPIDKHPEDLYIGFKAEDVADVYPIAAEYNENGQVEMWNIKVLFPALLKIVQDQQKEIEKLKEQVNNKVVIEQ
jgi:hypothetical protein